MTPQNFIIFLCCGDINHTRSVARLDLQMVISPSVFISVIPRRVRDISLEFIFPSHWDTLNKFIPMKNKRAIQ